MAKKPLGIYLLLCAIFVGTGYYFYYMDACLREQQRNYASSNEKVTDEPPLLTMHCASGRLGNQLALFATLHGVSDLNGRRAALQKCHVKCLKRYFDLSSIPVVKLSPQQEIGYALKSYLRHEEDARVPTNATIFVGHPYPTSYTFYHHIASKIRQLLTFRDNFQQHANGVLQQAAEKHRVTMNPVDKDPAEIIFVGVHVRLTDYASYMKKRGGRKIDMSYFQKAMDYFRHKYGCKVLFVVVSDNRKWCDRNFKEFTDVFVSPGVSDPGYDMALMVASNHSIISYGTFSFWCAYLREGRGGETVRFDDYLLPGTDFLVVNPYNKVYPSNWIGISTTPKDYWAHFLQPK